MVQIKESNTCNHSDKKEIITNLYLRTHTHTKLMGTVAYCQVLYAAPVFNYAIQNSVIPIKQLNNVHITIVFLVASAYRTTSTASV